MALRTRDQHEHQEQIGEEHEEHHLAHVGGIRPDLLGDIEQLRHGDGVGEVGGLDEIDEVVAERRQADADGHRQHDQAIDLPARQAEAGGGLHRRLRDGLDAGAEDLDVEGAGKQRQRDDRPLHVGDHRDQGAGAVGHARQQVAEAEIEEIDLHQRRGVAEERDEAGDDAADPDELGALQPRAGDADQDGQDDGDDRQLERQEEALDHAGAVEIVVDEDEIDAGPLVEVAEPVVDRLHAFAGAMRTTVIPALVAGIHEISERRVMDEMDPGHKARDDLDASAVAARVDRSAAALGLLVHALGVVGRRHAPFLLQLDDAARLHPLLVDVLHELLEVGLAELHGDRPRRLHDAGQRHVVAALPVVVGQLAGDEGLVVEVADAVAVLEGQQRLLGAVEGGDLGAVLLGDVLVVEGARGAAQLLALEVFPALHRRVLPEQDGQTSTSTGTAYCSNWKRTSARASNRARWNSNGCQPYVRGVPWSG